MDGIVDDPVFKKRPTVDKDYQSQLQGCVTDEGHVDLRMIQDDDYEMKFLPSLLRKHKNRFGPIDVMGMKKVGYLVDEQDINVEDGTVRLDFGGLGKDHVEGYVREVDLDHIVFLGKCYGCDGESIRLCRFGLLCHFSCSDLHLLFYL